jgi:putative ABC transport system permease protein
MPVPLRYNVRSVFYRKTTTILTLVAIALTVAVVAVVLSVQQGLTRAAGRTGRLDNVVCLRKGSNSESESGLSIAEAQKLMANPEIAKAKDGSPLAIAEVYSGLYLARENGKGGTNVSVRGTSAKSLEVRDSVKVVEGRLFSPGSREAVVGRGLVGRIKGCRLGGVVKIKDEEWPVVGVIDGGGTAYESEIWVDGDQFRSALRRPGWSCFIFRAADPNAVGEPAKVEIEGSPESGAELEQAVKRTEATGLLGRLEGLEYDVKAMSERAYFVKQAGVMGMMVAGLAGLLAVLLSFGAVFGCTNTLLAAVKSRTREIGVLLSIGFRPRDVLLGFLLEAMVIGWIGGLAGIAVAATQHGTETGTFGFATFSESTFKFEVSPFVVATSLLLATVVGLLGGVAPAIRASRLKSIEALREA